MPKVSFLENEIKVSGYQKYSISTPSGGIKFGRPKKYSLITEALSKLKGDCDSLIDLGCSSGGVSFLAHNLGYREIFSLDHDEEYLKIINQVNEKLSITNIHAKKFSFGDELPQGDIIFMGALIHWVYSCTALFGSFGDIFSYLKNGAKKFLIIEWIDPSDGTIKNFKHTSHNKDIHKEEYTTENFEKGLKENIGEIISIENTKATRFLYTVKRAG
jgi:SAM-dependent methyltransferase